MRPQDPPRYAEPGNPGFTVLKPHSLGEWIHWKDYCEAVDGVEPKTVEEIRTEISRLNGQLSQISGDPLVIFDQAGDHNDPPEGGAFLDYSPALTEYSYRYWYPSTEAAKAALLKLALDAGTVPEPNGLEVDLSPEAAQYATRVWITRR